ncbi:glycosyltransferase 87 family protein [Trebonia sp.]|uniref:glycosyltransferase 87 family protein n=1 Tax=Trebonia sp. TaxID=2767075 RepID=UPI002618B3E1|nr:glycosyltransferase 87 family protein [Trebonia sp.]
MPRRWLAGVFAVSALWALLVAVFSTDSVHQLWGEIAACGYVLALVAVLAWKARGADVALALSFCGALLVPLGWMAARGLEQPEVAVVAQSAVTLLHHGTPYADPASLAATRNPNSYNPYLPVMTLFGLPRALFGDGLLTDPRVWFGVVFLVVFGYALRRGGAGDPWRWTVLVAATPVIAFELAVGGTDVPMVAFLCLGFALVWERQPVLAGLALGVAAAMKATAWPAVLVALAVLAVRDGRRQATVFTVTALAVVAVCVGPFLVLHPRALVENTIKFPLGLAHVTSQASSPLPGHDLAETGPVGHMIVVVLLVAAGLAVAASLVVRPPRSVPRAVLLLAGAMTLMFVLAPSTRFGYFIYPATLVIWLLAALGGRVARGEQVTPDPDVPAASSRTRWRTRSVTRPAA